MTNLKTMLLGSVAAISLAAAPVIAQQTTTPTEGAETAQMAPGAPAADGRSYEGMYGERFAEWGDRNVQELIGTTVVNDAGETIGEIDNFGLSGDQLVAVVGVGGFLGMGEHSVALSLDQLTFDGEQLVLAGVTREQLEAMPEYNEGDAELFAADQSLRAGYEGMAMPPVSDAAGITPSENPAADAPIADAEEDVAAAAEADAEAGAQPMTGEQTAEGAQAGQEISEESAQIETETAQAAETPMAAETAAVEGGWTDEMDTIFADIADRQIDELIGMEVASAEGEVVGEVDNFALQGEDVVAIVGIGGFLGIGEHDVALRLGDMSYDGEKLVLSAMTEDQLRELPEYDEAEANYLPPEGTLRSTYTE